MDLLAYLRVLRRRWVLIVVVAAIGAVIGAGTAVASDDSTDGGAFKATHLMFLDTNTGDSGSSSAFTNLDQIAVLVPTGDVPERVGDKLGENGRELAERVIVSTNSVSSTLEITAVAETADEAEELANTFAEELIASLTEKDQARFNQRRDRVLQRLDEIQAEIAQLDAQIAAGGGDVVRAQRDGLVNQYRLTYEQFQQLAETGEPVTALSTLESATAVAIDGDEYNERLRRGQLGENIVQVGAQSGTESDEEITTSESGFSGPVSRGALGAFLGLLLGAGIAIAADHLDRRLRSRQDVEDAYGVPVLSEIPKLNKRQRDEDEVVSYTSPLSRTAEAHRAVRSALLFQFVTREQAGTNGDGAPAATASFVAEDAEVSGSIVVLVTSAQPNEGKTTTTANLAAVFAESGASVLAVNCDFRRPSLHRYLGAPLEPRRVHETKIPGVAMVSGVVADPTANPAQVIAAQRQVIATARERFDVILLDTAPLLTTNDAIEIIPSVDLVVVVARPDVTTADGAERTRTMLERVEAPVAGVVYVGDETASNDEYYYYNRENVVVDAMKRDAAATPATSDIAGDTDTDTDVDDDAEVETTAHDEDAEPVEAVDDDGVAWSSIAGGEPAAVPSDSDDEATEEIAAVTTAEPEDESAEGGGRRRRFLRRSRDN